MKRNTFRMGFGKTALLVGAAVLAVGGVAGYKLFFSRPGEAAIALIPSDADIVITLDTKPSPSQVVTFQKINEALKANNVPAQFDEFVGMFLSDSTVPSQIRKHLENSFAIAMWVPNDMMSAEGPEMAAFLAVNNPSAVEGLLAEHGKKSPQGYSFNESTFATMKGPYLVVSPSQAVIQKVVSSSTSLESTPEYQAARASLPEDANLMLFMSPKAFSAMSSFAGQPQQTMSMKWAAMGVTVREAGLELSYRAPVDSSLARSMARIAPLDQKLLMRIPDGAYGVMAFSQPGRYWNVIQASAGGQPGMSEGFDEAIKEFERQTGLSLPKDIIPALEGNLLLAVYPSPTQGADSVDGILIVDTQNGATPSELAAKLMKLVEKESKGEASFTTRQEGDATIYTINEAAEDSLQASLGATGGPMADKTVTFATVNGNLIFASSDAMLSRALQSYSGGGKSLLSQPSYEYMSGRLEEDSIYAMLVDLRAILEANRPALEESMSQSGLNVENFIGLFGGRDRGFVISGRMDREVAYASGFLPLDYVKCINVLSNSGVSQPVEFEPPPADPALLR